MDRLTQLMDKMDDRQAFVVHHCQMQQKLFAMWQDPGLRMELWGPVIRYIDTTIQFVLDNSDMFPNGDLHVDQYQALRDLATTLQELA